jgi:hypothetical protein
MKEIGKKIHPNGGRFRREILNRQSGEVSQKKIKNCFKDTTILMY